MTQEIFNRAFEIGRILDPETRTVEAVISTEHPVLRWDGVEILEHSLDAIDLSRGALPLIVAHDTSSLPVGIVESLSLQGKELRGVLRFSKNSDSIWTDVQDGILKNVSIGYRVIEKSVKKDGKYTVTKWQPYECSLVAAGADPKAQIKRTFETGVVKKMDVNDLKKDRKAAQDEMRSIAETAEMTEEQTARLRELKADVEKMNLRIEALSLTETDTGSTKQRCQLEISEPNGREFRSTAEYQRIYDKFLRQGKSSLYPDEIRALTVGSDPSMGYVVPTSFETKIVEGLKENNIMRSICTVIPTTSDRNIPIEDEEAEAYWTGEGKVYTETDMSVINKVLGAHKLTCLIKCSEELAFDSGFDMTTYISGKFGRKMGDKEEAAFISGDGVSKPKGVALDAELGKTSANSALLVFDEILDLVHSLGRAYRKRAVFMMSDDALKLIRKIKDGESRYIYQESLQLGEPNTLLGRPVYISEAMPLPTAGNTAILYGDFSYYWIADRAGRYFQQLNELYAESGMIGYRANQRTDGKLILPEAVKKLVMKA